MKKRLLLIIASCISISHIYAPVVTRAMEEERQAEVKRKVSDLNQKIPQLQKDIKGISTRIMYLIEDIMYINGYIQFRGHWDDLIKDVYSFINTKKDVNLKNIEKFLFKTSSYKKHFIPDLSK